MKKKLLLKSIIGLLAAVFLLISCSKEEPVATPNDSNQTVDYKMNPVSKHILNFQQKVKDILSTPDYKSTEIIPVEEALWDIEACMNFTYGHTNTEVNNIQDFSSVITLPSNEDNTMTELHTALSTQLVVQTMREHFDACNDDLKNVLSVNVVPVENLKSTQQQVEVQTTIGSNREISSPTYNDSWWYGNFGGMCSYPYLGEGDAANILQNTISLDIPNPVTYTESGACHVYFTDVEEYSIEAHNFPNPDDDVTDNYLDYLLFYATSTLGPLTDVEKCLEPTELYFYDEEIRKFINNASVEGKDRMSFLVEDDTFYVGQDQSIVHNVLIYFGYMHIDYLTCLYPIDPRVDF